MPPCPELRMSFADQAALTQELANNLRHGRAFLLGESNVEVLADCVLVLVHPVGGRTIGLRGQVVMVSDSAALRGVGIQLRPFDAGVVQTLEAFAAGDPDVQGNAEVAQAPEAQEAEAGEDGEREEADHGEHEHEHEHEHEQDADALDDCDGSEDESEADDEGDHGDLAAGEGEQGEEGEEGEPGSEVASDRQAGPKRHERLRKLNVTQQHKLARNGELNDRVLLERIYGKGVWEGLLQNPKLTLPEVARIARKGSVPRPLIEQIVENNAWIQSPLVRRALLSNPRVSGEGILKLLRITPRHELKVICKTNTYSQQVRDAARKVLDL